MVKIHEQIQKVLILKELYSTASTDLTSNLHGAICIYNSQKAKVLTYGFSDSKIPEINLILTILDDEENSTHCIHKVSWTDVVFIRGNNEKTNN